MSQKAKVKQFFLTIEAVHTDWTHQMKLYKREHLSFWTGLWWCIEAFSVPCSFWCVHYLFNLGPYISHL